MMSSTRSPALKVLQTSPNGGHLVGKRRTPAKKDNLQTKKLTDFYSSKIVVNDDAKPAFDRKFVSVCTTTELVLTDHKCTETDIVLPVTTERVKSRDEIVNDLCGDEPGVDYWKDLAEERRLALEEALRENLECYQEMARLREENRRLEKIAEEGQALADVLRDAVASLEEDNRISRSSEHLRSHSN